MRVRVRVRVRVLTLTLNLTLTLTLILTLTLPLTLTLTLTLASRVVSSRAELEGMLHTASLYRTTDATNCNEVRRGCARVVVVPGVVVAGVVVGTATRRHGSP